MTTTDLGALTLFPAQPSNLMLSHALDVYSAYPCPCGVWVSACQSTHPSHVVGIVPLLCTVSFEAGFFSY